MSACKRLGQVSEASWKLLMEAEESSPPFPCWLFAHLQGTTGLAAGGNDHRGGDTEFGDGAELPDTQTQSRAGMAPGGTLSSGSALLLTPCVTWMGSCTRWATTSPLVH